METILVYKSTDTETVPETSSSMTLDGESWKNRENATYTSLLDMYGAPKLFSSEKTNLYSEIKQEDILEQQNLVDYIFSGQMQVIDEEENLIDYIFSKEIELSKVKNYNKDENDYFLCFVMAEILIALIFIRLLVKFNAKRKKRREEYEAEINLES